MAAVFQVDMTTRKSALQSFTNAFGEYKPRQPIPQWWQHFEQWYSTRGADGTQEDKDSCRFLRTEAFGYDEDVEV
jgi:hypothetical protein